MRTCDHGTDGPRNGGAASGDRGAVYGSGVHVDWTSSARCAEERGSDCRCGIGGVGPASGDHGAVKAFHVGCASGVRCGEWRFSGSRCGSGGGSPSSPENFSCRRAWAGETCLAGALDGSVLTDGGVEARGVQAVGVAAGGTVGTGGWGSGDGDADGHGGRAGGDGEADADGHGGRAGGGCDAGGGVAGIGG